MTESVNSDRHEPPGVTSRLAGSRTSRMGLALVLGIALVGSLVYLLVLALGGAQLVRIALPSVGTTVAMHDATPWLIVAVIAAVASLSGWVLTERQLGRFASAQAAEREARANAQRIQDRLRDSEARRERVQRERLEDRAQREQIVRAWRSEREWNRELQGQIGRMQRAQGVLGRHDDVRKAVLELTNEPGRR
ncbi:MAG: hypothetical protein M3022_04475 [Actinomycetota bacterium]|nr:hypothetical protein [Actinomycetota bacterium]